MGNYLLMRFRDLRLVGARANFFCLWVVDWWKSAKLVLFYHLRLIPPRLGTVDCSLFGSGRGIIAGLRGRIADAFVTGEDDLCLVYRDGRLSSQRKCLQRFPTI